MQTSISVRSGSIFIDYSEDGTESDLKDIPPYHTRKKYIVEITAISSCKFTLPITHRISKYRIFTENLLLENTKNIAFGHPVSPS